MPFRLDAIRGHQAAVSDIVRRFEQGRVPHALLIEGPDGVGKRSFALAVAGLLLCERPSAGGACGECPSCVKVDAGGHPDFHQLPLREPEAAPAKPKPVRKAKGKEKGKGKEEAPEEEPAAPPPPYKKNILVDDIRALERALRFRALEGRAKVALIDEAHRMGPGDQPQNALLKTLEEPPPDTHLLLVTSHRRLLLPTIISRCQAIRLGPLSPEACEAVLASAAPSLDAEARRFLVAFGEGAPGRCAGLDLDGLRERLGLVRELDDGLEPGSKKALGSILEGAVKIAEDRGALREHLDAWAVWSRDVALTAAGVPDGVAHADRREQLRALAERRGLQASLRRAEAVLEARRQLDLPNNLNAKMIVEQLCLTLIDGVPLRRVR